jgi:tRNA (mo5U34)-methyltransferase
MSAPLHEPPCPLPDARAWVKSFRFWYHNIYLGNGVYTMGDGAAQHHELVWQRFEKTLPPSFVGLSVLDVGTNAGYFALQAKLRGARRVVGTEVQQEFLDQAQQIRKIWNVDIDYRLADTHDVARLNESFDLVVFAGILYHLKHPLFVLEALGNLCTDAILLETEFIPDDPRNCLVVRQGTPAVLQPTHHGAMKFIETTELNGDASNWWVPDTECVRGMLRTAGFVHISRPVVLHETRLLLVASRKQNSILDLYAFGR